MSKITLGLDRIQRLLEHITYTRPTIHVAGTNGKGSVCTLLESALAASGLKVGKFTSPHLVSPEDCVSISKVPITAETWYSVKCTVLDISAKEKIGASSFEIQTAAALSAFEQAKVDVVILEVGMGGRLDATNVLPDDRIIISVVTAVDLDHQTFLGSTVRAIAGEKCAIVRKEGILVLGEQSEENEEDVRSVAEEVASKIGAKAIVRCVGPAEFGLDESAGELKSSHESCSVV